MDTPLLKTKLYVPQTRSQDRVVSRPLLVERLTEGLRPGCRLILVSAPAGFGKTTLLSEWIAHCTPDTHVAWLSLDGEDNDLTRFLTYLVAAIQTLEPGFAKDILALMQSPRPPDAEVVLTAVSNVLADHAKPTALVLDDYHEIVSAEIHDALAFLLEHLPPHVHLVLSSRTDPPWPLARLRTREQMIELRAQDLRFSLEQALTFMNDVMALNLSAENVAALDTRTEGWIAGLQMAALSMQRRDATHVAGFIRSFGGSHRFVLDYLVEEVLNRQNDEIQAFLLQTSILDRLTAPLCDAVLAIERNEISPAPDSRTLLARLERANLFLVPLDDERRWYRYHHLFGDLLRKRLQETHPERIPKAHLQASAWYEGQGSVHEAVLHAQAAGDHDRVAQLVLRYAAPALMRGDFGRVGRWVEALPQKRIRSQPLLCLVRAWTLLGDPQRRDDAASWHDRALELSAAHPDPRRDLDGSMRTDHEIIRQSTFLFRVNLAAAQDADPEELIDLCLEALEALPEGATFYRGGVTFYLAQAYRQLHDRKAAARAFAQAKELGLATEGHGIALAVSGMEAVDAWERGDLHAVARICRETMASLIRPAEQAGGRVPTYACLVYVLLGRTLVAWNALQEAEPLLVRGVELAERAMEPGARVDGCRDLARLHWMQGDFQEAHTWMDRAVEACPWDRGYLHALRARIWLAQAEDDSRWLEKAVQWADGRVLEDPEEYSWELQSLVRVHLAQYRAYGKPDLEPVLTILEAHIEAPADTSSGWQVEVWTLKALLLQALGRMEEAVPTLVRALTIAKKIGQVLAFLEHGLPMVNLLKEAVRRDSEASYARRILEAFEAHQQTLMARQADRNTPLTQTALVEPLSERELQVLRYLQGTLSLGGIADQLYLSIHTVRSHVKHIYTKLDVHSRGEAIARAEELGLL